MMTKCQRCGGPYMHSKSTSALVLTYCGVLCETADLGFSLAAFEKMEVPAWRPALVAVAARTAFAEALPLAA